MNFQHVDVSKLLAQGFAFIVFFLIILCLLWNICIEFGGNGCARDVVSNFPLVSSSHACSFDYVHLIFYCVFATAVSMAERAEGGVKIENQ